MTVLPCEDSRARRIPDETAPARRSRPLGCLFELLETLVLTVVIFFGVQAFVAQPYQVEMHSMETTLEPGQYVLVDKLSPRWSPYARGDVVVFSPPESIASRRDPFIKRVIGIGGDHVELRDGGVLVNGIRLAEPYVFREPDSTPQRTDPVPGGQTEWFVAAGEVLLFGDHRAESADSRVFGPVEVSKVIGRAWLRYWPLPTFGILSNAGSSSVEPSSIP